MVICELCCYHSIALQVTADVRVAGKGLELEGKETVEHVLACGSTAKTTTKHTKSRDQGTAQYGNPNLKIKEMEKTRFRSGAWIWSDRRVARALSLYADNLVPLPAPQLVPQTPPELISKYKVQRKS